MPVLQRRLKLRCACESAHLLLQSAAAGRIACMNAAAIILFTNKISAQQQSLIVAPRSADEDLKKTLGSWFAHRVPDCGCSTTGCITMTAFTVWWLLSLLLPAAISAFAPTNPGSSQRTSTTYSRSNACSVRPAVVQASKERMAAAAAGDDSTSSDSSSSSADAAEASALQDISSVDMRAFRARLVAYGLNFGNSSTPGIAAPAASAVRSRSTVESKWAHEISNIELGCLVVANETLFTEQQTYFYKAVIMIIEHGEQGTAGLILNLPTSHKMGEVLEGNLMSLPGLEQV
jgi:Uncharacterized ACR, COG1678